MNWSCIERASPSRIHQVFQRSRGEDRPMPKPRALRLFPHLEHLKCAKQRHVLDFSPVAALRKLKYFSIAEYGDLYGCQPISLAQCGEMPELERLHLARHPWQDLRALATWPALIDVRQIAFLVLASSRNAARLEN